MSDNDFLNLKKIKIEKEIFVIVFTSPTLLLEILNFAIESLVNDPYFDSKNNFGVVVIVPNICIYTGESRSSICSLPVWISIL